MSRLRLFASKYGLDALIVVAAIWGAAGTALRADPYLRTGMALWFEVMARRAEVEVQYGPRDLRVVVRDDGRGTSNGDG